MPLWLLGVPVSLLALLWGLLIQWRRNEDKRLSAMKAVSLDSGRLRELVNGLRPNGRLVFFWLGMAFLSVALARPQLGWLELPRFEQSREVIVALDLSKSMWADDVKPSRLERSRLLVDNLLDQLKGERVGLVLFAGTAFTQSPLSADYEVLREFLPELSPEYLPQGGTNYAAMLDVVLDSFSQGPDSSADRYLIILSDGESLSNDWQSRMEDLKGAEVKVIALGVGTPAGAVIQDPSGGVIKDQNGSVVLSRLNATTLQALARGTGGEYRQADRWLDLPDLLRLTVEKGRKGAFSENSDRKPMERYQFPLLIGLFFLVLSFWREYPVRLRVAKDRAAGAESVPTKSALSDKKAIALPSNVVSVVLVLVCCISAMAQTPETHEAISVEKLKQAIEQLSQKDVLQVQDYATLANVTVQTGTELLARRSSLPRGAVEDGLSAVFEGEKLDATAADWDALRKALEELLKETPEQKQEEQDRKEQEQREQNQQQQNNAKSGDTDQSDQPGDQEQQSAEDSDQSQNSEGSESESNSQNPTTDEGRSGDESTSKENPSEDEEQDSSLRNEQNELGPLQEEAQSGSESAEEQPQPEAQAAKPQKLQTIQGTSNEGSQSQSKDPKVVAAMKELSEVKDRDVPAQLFQRLQRDQQPQQQGRDW
ncbi:MAG: VWA domain-containing protein [Verrucomicrobiota bacterium]